MTYLYYLLYFPMLPVFSVFINDGSLFVYKVPFMALVGYYCYAVVVKGRHPGFIFPQSIDFKWLSPVMITLLGVPLSAAVGLLWDAYSFSLTFEASQSGAGFLALMLVWATLINHIYLLFPKHGNVDKAFIYFLVHFFLMPWIYFVVLFWAHGGI